MAKVTNKHDGEKAVSIAVKLMTKNGIRLTRIGLNKVAARAHMLTRRSLEGLEPGRPRHYRTGHLWGKWKWSERGSDSMPEAVIGTDALSKGGDQYGKKIEQKFEKPGAGLYGIQQSKPTFAKWFNSLDIKKEISK